MTGCNARTAVNCHDKIAYLSFEQVVSTSFAKNYVLCLIPCHQILLSSIMPFARRCHNVLNIVQTITASHERHATNALSPIVDPFSKRGRIFIITSLICSSPRFNIYIYHYFNKYPPILASTIDKPSMWHFRWSSTFHRKSKGSEIDDAIVRYVLHNVLNNVLIVNLKYSNGTIWNLFLRQLIALC